jgi:hypothetical protein
VVGTPTRTGSAAATSVLVGSAVIQLATSVLVENAGELLEQAIDHGKKKGKKNEPSVVADRVLMVTIPLLGGGIKVRP